MLGIQRMEGDPMGTGEWPQPFAAGSECVAVSCSGQISPTVSAAAGIGWKPWASHQPLKLARSVA